MAVTDDQEYGRRTMNGAPPPPTLADIIPSGYSSPNVIDRRNVDPYAFDPGTPLQGGYGSTGVVFEDGSMRRLAAPMPPRRPSIIVDPFENVINRIYERAQQAVRRSRTDFANLEGPLGRESQGYGRRESIRKLEDLFDVPRSVAQTQIQRGRLKQERDRQAQAQEAAARGEAMHDNPATEMYRRTLSTQGQPRTYTGLDPLQAAGTIAEYPLPGAKKAAQITEEITRRALKAGYRLTPAAQPALTPSGTTREQETASEAGGAIAGTLIPQNVWQGTLELIPGVGTVPDVIKVIRKGGPEAALAIRALRQAGAKEGEESAVEAFLRGVGSESGRLGPDGRELNPVTADDVIGSTPLDQIPADYPTGTRLRNMPSGDIVRTLEDQADAIRRATRQELASDDVQALYGEGIAELEKRAARGDFTAIRGLEQTRGVEMHTSRTLSTQKLGNDYEEVQEILRRHDNGIAKIDPQEAIDLEARSELVRSEIERRAANGDQGAINWLDARRPIGEGPISIVRPNDDFLMMRGYTPEEYDALSLRRKYAMSEEYRSYPRRNRNQFGLQDEPTAQLIAKWQTTRPQHRGMLETELKRRAEAGDLNAGAVLRGELGALGTGGPSSLRRDIATRAGASAVGGAVGATQGDSPEERLRNAVLGAGAGLGGADIAIRGGIVDNVGRGIARGSDEAGALGDDILRQQQGPEAAGISPDAAPSASPAPEALPDSASPYFDDPPPNANEIRIETQRTNAERRIEELRAYLETEDLATETGNIRTVNRPRANTGLRAGAGERATMRVVEQTHVDDGIYAQLKRTAENKGRPFNAEKDPRGGWWVDIEDELPGAARSLSIDEPDSGDVLDRLRKARNAQRELRDLERQTRGMADEPDIRAVGSYFRDVYHRLTHDLATAEGEEAASISDTWGRYAQAYEDVRTAIAAGRTDLPPYAREVLGLPERSTLAGDATTQAAAPIAGRNLSPADFPGEGTGAVRPRIDRAAPTGTQGAQAPLANDVIGLPPGRPNAPNVGPTIREIEARSAPLTPEQRARMPRETERAFYEPPPFKASTDPDVADATGAVGATFQRVQDVANKIPVLKSFAQFAEPMAGARASRRAGNIIPEAIVRRDLFADTQKAQARAGLYAWIEQSRKALGLSGKGIARDVGIRVDAEIPAAVKGRIDDIIEHPEDYVLNAEQAAALDRARHSFNAVTQQQLEAGVDVREIEGGYFPRIVTRSPKGEPKGGIGAGSLTKRPGHTKAREFADLREGVAAGYEYANPYEAMLARLEAGIDSIAGRRTLETIKPLGQKPSERVPQALRDAYLSAKDAYKANRSTLNEKALEDAKRALRVAARKANEPNIGEAKAFGRIFPQAVTDEIAKYTDSVDPNIIEEYFRLQRASTTTADLSAALIQGHNLFFRNNVAWWKAFGHSLVSIAKEPTGYIAKNIDDVTQAIDARAAIPPSEFQLEHGGKFSQLGAKAPIVKQAQRAFEWMVFVAQVEWWKAARRTGMSTEEARELGAVIRKGTGSMLRPGLTNKQRTVEPWTFFATRFMMAVNSFGADALRGGIRGAEARRTLGSAIAGATALTVAAQLATDGTMPNLTDPNNRDKPWLGVKRPGGTVNFFGPLHPYVKAYAAMGQDLANGDPKAAADEAIFLGRSRLSLPLSSLIDLIYQEDIMGNPVEGPKDFAVSQAKRFLPMSGRSIAEDGLEAQREFPEGNFQALGGRSSRASEYRQTVNAAEPYIEEAGGDFRAAYNAATQAGDMDAQAGIKSRWKRDFETRAAPLGLRIVDGDFVERGEVDLVRGPEIEIDSVEKLWNEEGWESFVRDQLAAAWDYDGEGSQRIKAIVQSLSGFDSASDMRAAYVERAAPEYVALYGGTLDTAEDALKKDFNALDEVKNHNKAKQYDRLDFWREHPDLLYEAWLLGIEDDNEDEREIMEAAGYAVY